MSALAVGRKHMAEAAASLKTSVFKWSPDWLSAAHSFEKAAVSFKAAAEPELAVDAFTKGAEAHKKSKSDLAAAKCLESAGEVMLEKAKKESKSSIVESVKCSEAAANLFSEAVMYYREGGENSKAAACVSNKARALSEAGESLPQNHPKREQFLSQALDDFLLSCEILESNGRAVFSVDTFRHCLNFVVKMKRWKDAITVIDRMIPVYEQLKQKSGAHKLRLSKVIIRLCQDDIVAARNSFREGFDDSDYLRSDECAAAEDLLNAWEKLDEEGVRAVLARQVFAFLERQVSLVAQTLTPQSGFELDGTEADFERELQATPTKQVSQTSVQNITSSVQSIHLDKKEETIEQMQNALFAKKQPSSSVHESESSDTQPPKSAAPQVSEESTKRASDSIQDTLEPIKNEEISGSISLETTPTPFESVAPEPPAVPFSTQQQNQDDNDSDEDDLR